MLTLNEGPLWAQSGTAVFVRNQTVRFSGGTGESGLRPRIADWKSISDAGRVDLAILPVLVHADDPAAVGVRNEHLAPGP